ncbi:ISXO2 transposase-like protein [Breznakia blatticola]|uniref:ISXO2 transposase-like protein n=1 Tax=Breznakia blatticola TaxID=1754012 RepID=A0A4R7Z689_9FIRM|nr:IS1595 family transposase [Breznakia blatticola]TDW06788.1 ISXO2 transposase-like protein [Breznakia blatticola]
MKQSVLLKSIAALTPFQKRMLETKLIDLLKLNEIDKNAKPDVCPCCGKESNMIKKGFCRGKQRYQCKDCKKIFSYNSGLITMYSRLERSMFQQIVFDTISCVPIKETAAKLDLSIQCVFENRHKVLCALEQLLIVDDEKLSGTIEIDETYELESQKGSRNIKRKARKRGEPSNFRGLSHEQVCIVTTTDRNGHEIFKAVGYGKPTSISILDNFERMLVKKSVIYSDGAFCYNQLAKNEKCELVPLKTHHSYNQVEHINTVNSIHGMIKTQLANYRGVATKYMNRYLSLFVFIRKFLDMDDNEWLPIILRKLKTLHFTITRNALKTHKLFSTYQ